MTVCPIALAVGCRKCPALSVCPLKGTLGDYKKDEPVAPAGKAGASRPGAKKPR